MAEPRAEIDYTPIEAVEAAEAEALAHHEGGTCHLSEWSCSHCEATRGGSDA